MSLSLLPPSTRSTTTPPSTISPTPPPTSAPSPWWTLVWGKPILFVIEREYIEGRVETWDSKRVERAFWERNKNEVEMWKNYSMKIQFRCCIVYNKIVFSLFFYPYMCNENMILFYKCATESCFLQKGNFRKCKTLPTWVVLLALPLVP